MFTEKGDGLSLLGWMATYAVTYFALVVALAVVLREDVVDYLIRERVTLMTITIAAVSLAITTTVDHALARDEEEE